MLRILCHRSISKKLGQQCLLGRLNKDIIYVICVVKSLKQNSTVKN